MLSSISWQQYFAAIAVIGISYYLYVLLRYYQREIAELFSPKNKPSALAPNGSVSPFTIMGSARQDQNVSVVDERDLNFEPSYTDDYLNDGKVSRGTDQLNDNDSSQGQLTTEIGNLIDAYADIDSKAEFLSLLTILINSYREQDVDLQMDELAHHILNRSSELPFDVAADELSTEIK